MCKTRKQERRENEDRAVVVELTDQDLESISGGVARIKTPARPSKTSKTDAPLLE